MNAVALDILPRDALYARFMAGSQGDPIEDTLARILASWMNGEGVLPHHLGLSQAAFEQMLARHFPGFPAAQIVHPKREQDIQRGDEINDLHQLLIQYRSGHSDSEIWMADIVIVACLGSDHLWQDLGLWCRADLSKLMLNHFKPLAQRNTQDMKWKKFLYKQLCAAEGIYVCRAPSCEVCTDYAQCFGSEE